MKQHFLVKHKTDIMSVKVNKVAGETITNAFPKAGLLEIPYHRQRLLTHTKDIPHNLRWKIISICCLLCLCLMVRSRKIVTIS